MLIVYSNKTSPRLEYICAFIFNEQLQTEFEITTEQQTYQNYDGIKINYSQQPVACNEIKIQPAALLFETGIKAQPINCFDYNGFKAFFKTGDIENNQELAFDIFAASFYLLSRYEEYLPHQQDSYGRYGHENSLAFREGFLHLPLINIWIHDFANIIKAHFPAFKLPTDGFGFLPTYDIDLAFSYQHKGWIRNLGGFIKSPSLQRLQVLAGLQQDPFDVYDWLDQLHHENNLQPVYFFLLAQKNGSYDKNILPRKKALQKLLQHHAGKYACGIHPSWQSGDNFLLLKQEKRIMEQVTEKEIVLSRQHYIRFHLPSSYRRLAEAGITDDYSMGYGSINGFRASTGTAFYWYDLQKDACSHLKVHPFCFMDANAFYEQQQNPSSAFAALQHYYSYCKKYQTTFCTIWHNNFLGTDPLYKGWKECYENLIRLIQQ